MARCRCCKENVEEECPIQERDVSDIEMEESRRQVRKLQQRLECYETLGHNESHHNAKHEAPSSEDEDFNPFHRDLCHHSRESFPPPCV